MTVPQTVSGPDSHNGVIILSAELGQSNENEQEGVAIAAAVSDYVSVEKNGDLSVWRWRHHRPVQGGGDRKHRPAG